MLPLATAAAAAASTTRPNMLMVLCDDLDLVLGGMDAVHQPTHIPALRARGLQLDHWFTHVPVCCPSRATLMTGRMFHNLALVPRDRWGTDGHGHAEQCMYINETQLSPGPTFAEHLGAAGYLVAAMGKYLNLSPRGGSGCTEPWSASCAVEAPAGMHYYFVNPGPMAKSPLDATGEYYPSWYLLGSPAFNGTFRNGDGTNGTLLYETDLLAQHATQWLTNVSDASPEKPFFLYLAPHGPHGAAIPAPQHRTLFPNVTAPRDSPSWNASGVNHHWLVRQQPPTRAGEVVKGDEHYRNRWRCMMSVDELVGAVVGHIEALGRWKQTFAFFSSDHGFHFHQLRLGVGKVRRLAATAQGWPDS